MNKSQESSLDKTVNYLQFEKLSRIEGRKTDIYEIWTGGKDFEEGGAKYADLGEIKWYGPWRKYAFFPNEGTLYDGKCLNEITTFLEKIMLERKQSKIQDEN